MSFRNLVNDGSANLPRLRVQFNLWGLKGLPRDGHEWSLPEKLDRIRAAGAQGLEAVCSSEQEADELAGMLRDRGMGIGFAAFGAEADDLLPAIELANRMRADYLSVQFSGALRTAPQIAKTLREMYELANDSGLPLFIETHRGKVTQDLRRTVKVIRRFGRVRFTGDFSHYIVAGELGGVWGEEVWDHFRAIARRCGNWHGRIGFGEQVQNDIGDGTGETAQQFRQLWTMGMSAWLKKAEPGDILPFCVELGPPGYSITDLGGREISDRWEQGLVIKRLAEEAWGEAQTMRSGAEVVETSETAAGETAAAELTTKP